MQLAEANSGIKLEMKEVSFSYTDETDILQNISLKIEPNEKVCISGKDSSGKSTLLKLMTGSYTDFNGSLLIDDVPMGNYNLASLRAQTGVLMSQQDIFQGTLLENIALGNPSITIEAVKEYAAKTGLTDFIASLKDGYDTMLDPTGKRLARNVVHRILLVRALANKPRLLLLEEPWMNMSREHRSQILELLNGIKNTTLVVVTNDEEYIQQCDKVIVMNENGSINN